jgi:hypothetical protein
MSVHASPADPALQPYWRALEANLEASPGPELAARDLRRALARGRSGTIRSGGFFQSRLAPWLAGLAPESWRRAAQTRYFGGR